MGKEDKTKEYIRKIFNCKDCIFYKDCMYGIGNNNVKEYNCPAIDEAESFKAGWDEALKSQFRKCVNNKPIEGQEPNDGENVILLCQMLCGRLEGYIFLKANTFKNGDWEWQMLMHYNVIAWMPIPSFDKILEDNKDVFKRLKNR